MSDKNEKWFTCTVRSKAQNEEHVRDLLHENWKGLSDALVIEEVIEELTGKVD